MSVSELITSFHLGRQALIYIRQSSPHQVLTNQESRRLQFALKQRALECGWAPEAIEIIDTDRSRTARTTQGRHGFQELVTRITLDQVGIIFSYDVTRMARNCTDWYQVLDLCGYRCCLVGDRDGIYDPSSINGRLLLGLKGQIAELELHTIKRRLTDGLLNKAQRGELALTLPVGLIRDSLGASSNDPIAKSKTASTSSSPLSSGSGPSPESSVHLIIRTYLFQDATHLATSSGADLPSPLSARS